MTVRIKILSAFAALTAVLGLGLVPSGATAQTTGSAIPPVRKCGELKTIFPHRPPPAGPSFHIPGASTHVTTAEVAAGTPEYCNVEGFVEPAVRFQLKLPTTTYAGRYVQYGCDGLCGVFQSPAFPQCGGAHGGDFAVAATTDGHEGKVPPPFPPNLEFLKIMDGTWAADNQAARDDYFFRAPHVLSLAAKRIIAAYYGSPPRTSYFSGCSTGGREGLLLAQRYPHDFDGIIAGAPTHNMGPLIGMYMAWLARTNIGPDGRAILTHDKLPALHNAAVAACDRLDGLVDSQIDDPRACRFDPVAIQCPAGTDQPTCLTPAQVATTRALYEGPRDPQGRRLYPGWQGRGSELAWAGSSVPEPAFGFTIALLPDNYLRYVGYPIGTPHSSLADIRFTKEEFDRLTPEGVKGNAMGLDLGEFRRSGGKLILWHGWNDQSIPAVGTADYYQRLWERNGGLLRTQQWARLFMVPTKNHCDAPPAGPQLTGFDPLPALVGWVERGNAPDRIVATGTSPEGNARSRPVFPYPLRAKYDGSGSVDDARNFGPALPLVAPRTIDWVGTYLHDIAGPVAR